MRKNWKFVGWYYHRDGGPVGPFPTQEITRMVACGELRTGDEVLQAWKDENNRMRYFGNQADSCGRDAHFALAPS